MHPVCRLHHTAENKPNYHYSFAIHNKAKEIELRTRKWFPACPGVEKAESRPCCRAAMTCIQPCLCSMEVTAAMQWMC